MRGGAAPGRARGRHGRGARPRPRRAVLWATAGLLASALSASPAAAATSSGFGAPVAAFQAAHPPNSTDCPLGPCYGPLEASLRPIPEFSFLSEAKGLVLGWDQALPKGTPVLEAERRVAELLPADAVRGSAFTVIHRDQFGHGCAIYDLYSKSIARRFGKHGPTGDGSDIGVELATLEPSGATTYDPGNIDLAIVIPGWIDKTVDC